AVLQRGEDLVEDLHRPFAALPLGCTAEQVFLGDHFEDRPDVLGHAAMDEHQAVLEVLARLGRRVLLAEDAVIRQKPAAADAPLGVTFLGPAAGDELHAGPDAAGVLPPST